MGEQLAHLKMRPVLVKMLLRYDFKLAPDFDSVKWDPAEAACGYIFVFRGG